jgi:hypothetical protein
MQKCDDCSSQLICCQRAKAFKPTSRWDSQFSERSSPQERQPQDPPPRSQEVFACQLCGECFPGWEGKYAHVCRLAPPPLERTPRAAYDDVTSGDGEPGYRLTIKSTDVPRARPTSLEHHKDRVVDAALGDELSYQQLRDVLDKAVQYDFSDEELLLLRDCEIKKAHDLA